jgi:23S rRNA (cytosine1962-C5)-methyltransferase
MSAYVLLDSGENEKLEQYGEKVLIRPSKFSVWKKRRPSLWEKADASYVHKKGWIFPKESFEEWTLELDSFFLKLRLQQNGQIGFFPEHLLYKSEMLALLDAAKGARVLNLFAYTGLASIICAQSGAKVTHVDISKQVLRWAKENTLFTPHLDSQIRYIQEDAIAFLKREATRQNSYNLVISDPPAFSRVSQKESWDLEDIMQTLLNAIKNVLTPNGALIMTTHRFELGEGVLSNLIYDCFGDTVEVSEKTLFLHESEGPRKLPSGFLAIMKRC